MYVEINHLSIEEIGKIEELLNRKVRCFTNVYQEVCRVEAEVTLENVITDEYELQKMMLNSNYSNILDELAEDIHDNCDSVFQELCEISDEKVKEYLKRK